MHPIIRWGRVWCVLSVMCTMTMANGWSPINVGTLPRDVEHPSLLISTALSAPSASPFAAGSFGLPLVSVGANKEDDTILLQAFSPLQETIEAKLTVVSNEGADAVPFTGHPTVALANGTILYVSLCAETSASPTTNTISAFGGDSQTIVTLLWSENATSVVNASCMAVLLPTLVNHTSTLREYVAIIGGTQPLAPTAHHGGVVVSLFDPLLLTMYSHVAVVELPMRIEEQLHHPSVTQSSDGKVLLAAGRVTDGVDWRHNTVVMAWALTVAGSSTGSPPWQDSLLLYRLPDLPALLVPANASSAKLAITYFEENIYAGLVAEDSPGYMGRLELASLTSADSTTSSLEWIVEVLPGPNLDRRGASLIFLPLPHEGTVLAMFAVGGIPLGDGATPGISYVVVVASTMPSWVVVPYRPAGQIATNISETEVNVTVLYELIAAGASGVLAVGFTSGCMSFVGEPVNYQETSITAVFSWSVPIEDASSLWGAPLYLCFSTNTSVVWRAVDGNTSSSVLFDAVGPMEPYLFPSAPSAPSVAPSPSDSLVARIRRFLSENWLYVSLGALGLVIAIATVTIVCMLRRGGLRSAFTNERSRLLGGSDGGSDDQTRSWKGRYDPIKLSTNSHSSRYVTLSHLMTLDHTESDVTYLVQRKRDRAMLVMKYIPCDGDVERLLSIREFEALHMLQGHPNVVSYVDMFMNYAFSVQRMGKSHDTKYMMTDANDPTDSAINTESNLYACPLPSGLGLPYGDPSDIQSLSPTTSANLSPSSTPSPILSHQQRLPRMSLPSAIARPGSQQSSGGDAVTNNRYVCLVMEYMPHGNIASWLLKQSERSLPITRRARGVSVDQLPPAKEQHILSVALQIVSLLKYLHSDGEVTLAHKGLKPENIFVTGPPNDSDTFVPIAVSDFGFSVLGNYSPPTRATMRKRVSSELERGSEGSRSSMGQPMDTSGYLQSPKCDMWCFGCVLYALTTYQFGERFPYLAEVLRTDNRGYQIIQSNIRNRGYSAELASLTLSLLHLDENLRPSSDIVSRMIHRRSDGTLSLTAHRPVE